MQKWPFPQALEMLPFSMFTPLVDHFAKWKSWQNPKAWSLILRDNRKSCHLLWRLHRRGWFGKGTRKVSDEGAPTVSYHRNCGATRRGKWQNLIASHVCRIFTVKRTIFDVVPIRSWSLAVSFSLYYEQTFCSHIFWWGGEGDAITLWEYMQYPRRRFIADETLEKQTFFFYAVPCDFIAKAASTVKLGCIERGGCPAP